MNKVYVRRRTDKLSDHVEEKRDAWSVASKRKLKASMRNKMRRIFTTLLDVMDEELAKGSFASDTHQFLRSIALNVGNDQVRQMEAEIDKRYNVESLNYQVKFLVVNQGEKDEG